MIILCKKVHQIRFKNTSQKQINAVCVALEKLRIRQELYKSCTKRTAANISLSPPGSTGGRLAPLTIDK
jgi:hypothetical protein